MNAQLKFPQDTQAENDHIGSSWPAFLSLEFAQRQRGVRLVHAAHQGPLYVQKAFYPEGEQCAHSYLLHPPGGLVTGDTLSIELVCRKDAHALVTTPGAGRVYKARDQGGVQTQTVKIHVEENACLEWLPLETILFPNSQARLKTRIDLAEGAHCIAWDITCFGLPANKLGFTGGSVQQHLQIYVNKRIRLNERLVIELPQRESGDSEVLANSELLDEPDVLNASAGMQSKPVHGLLIAGPFEGDLEQILQTLRELTTANNQQDLVGITLNAGLICVRYLGFCTETARRYFTQAWCVIRPELIQKQAVAPRIWAT